MVEHVLIGTDAAGEVGVADTGAVDAEEGAEDGAAGVEEDEAGVVTGLFLTAAA